MYTKSDKIINSIGDTNIKKISFPYWSVLQLGFIDTLGLCRLLRSFFFYFILVSCFFPSHRPPEHYSRLDKSDFYRDYKTFNLFFYEQTYFPDNAINFMVDFTPCPFERRVYWGAGTRDRSVQFWEGEQNKVK